MPFVKERLMSRSSYIFFKLKAKFPLEAVVQQSNVEQSLVSFGAPIDRQCCLEQP